MLDLEGREGGGGEEEVEREAREIKGFTSLTEVHPHPYTPPPSHTHTHTHAYTVPLPISVVTLERFLIVCMASDLVK